MLVTAAKATHAQTRRHNNRLVLQTVYDQSPLSRADITRATNLTATTVSTVVGELLEEGLVEELGVVSTERGKPPTLISLAKDARHIVALDLSRNAFQGSILNLRGEIQYRQQIPLHNRTGDAALALVYSIVDDLLSATSTPLLGIGIGAPGIIDAGTNTIHQAANLGWFDLALGDLLSARYHLHTQVINDNQAVLLAENLFGTYKNSSDLVVVRIGNGIGAAIMCNGQLLHGNGIGEIGHIVVVEGGNRCMCGNEGCLETVASSRAIVKQARELASRHHLCMLNRLVDSPEEITIELVIQAYRAGDLLLEPLVHNLAYHLGSMLAHLVSVVGAPRILLCGSLTEFGPALLHGIQREVQRRSLTGRLTSPQIEVVTLTTALSDLIVMGASATLLANELGLFW
ncbi:MAG: ROK family protein [Caldilineaceae bacterium]|nr:ROK family protein [Caldilineaceae bacterium]